MYKIDAGNRLIVCSRKVGSRRPIVLWTFGAIAMPFSYEYYGGIALSISTSAMVVVEVIAAQ